MTSSPVATITSVAFQGVSTIPVHVQVQMAKGLPSFQVVGLPNKTVSESKERIRAALSVVGLGLPPKRITVNLSPADLLKEGSHFDLAITLGLLAVMDIISIEEVADYVVMGELALDGSIVGVDGVLPVAMMAVEQEKGLICPFACGGEATWSGAGASIVAAKDILSLIGHLKGERLLPPPAPLALEETVFHQDMSDIKGQYMAKRALEIAAAGGHNLLMNGPPGSGKSMLAHRLITILPPMSLEEALEVSIIHSVAGQIKNGNLRLQRPFRDPHHNISMPALVGGGQRAKPGEISLAHNGVLFLDELPEFSPAIIDSLRQPMENEEILIARANHHITYPARVQIIGAMNPCRCGYLHDANRACRKAPYCASDYQRRLSGPFLDRMDLRVDVPDIDPRDLRSKQEGESSAIIRERVQKTRDIQTKRLSGLQNKHGRALRVNANMDGKLLEEFAPLDQKSQEMLDKAIDKFGLSARGYYRVLRIARTIADMEGREHIFSGDVAEALRYRVSGTMGQ